MFHVGLDIHSARMTICVLNATGQVVHRSQARGIEEMLTTLKGLPDRFEVCYEAGCGYGHYHDLLRPLAVRVLAHPGQLRLVLRLNSGLPTYRCERREIVAAPPQSRPRFSYQAAR